MMNLNCQMVLILCYIFKMILNIPLKEDETLTSIPPIYVYINRINNRLVFEIKDGKKLELQTPETMNFIWQRKKIYRQNKKQIRSTKS